MHFSILDTNAIACLCSPHFSDDIGFQKSFYFLSSISLLIVLIPSFFYWIVDLFSILLSIVLHHISGVSSFDFAPEGAGWLHHWTKFQLNLNLIAWSIWLPSYVLFIWGISSLGASCPPLSGIFVICSSFEHILYHFWFWVCWPGSRTV